MQYFIGYLIRGEAADWHNGLAKEISGKFGTRKIYKRVPLHITLYRPFDTEDVTPIEKLSQRWSESYPAADTLTLSGFGRFDYRVLFVAVNAARSVIDKVAELQQDMSALSHVPFPDYPGGWHPHVTLMNEEDEEKVREAWDYLLTLPMPDITLPFDNVTLFRFHGSGVWKVDSLYALKSNVE